MNSKIFAEKVLVLVIVLFTFLHKNCLSQDDDLPAAIQQLNAAIELMNIDIIELKNPVQFEMMILKQSGENNQLTGIQQVADVGRTVIIAGQNGNDNTGYINQQGHGHFSISLQNGDKNEANLWSVGSMTKNFVQQSGIANLVNSYIENYNFEMRSATSVQLGNENKINLQITDGDQSNELKGIAILQNGNGNSADLFLSNFDAPSLKIEQKGGATISITHSAFNFPMK